MKFKKCMSLTMAVLFSLTTVGTALADDDLETQLSDIQERAERQQQITNEAAARVDNISEQVRIIEDQVNEASRSYYAVKKELDATQDKIDENEELLERTEDELKEKNNLLKKRVRDIYINGQISYIDVLFGAKDFSDLMTRMDVLKRIIKYDYDLVMVVKEKRNIIKTARAELEKDKANKKALVDDANMKLAELEDARLAKSNLLAQAESDKSASEAAYQELLSASEEIKNLIRQSQMPAYSGGYSGGGGSGGMVWPLNGPITSEYGWRTHPIYGTQRYHSGLDIGGDYGQPIVAAASGVVSYAGWISGYGYAVIIDHGGGVSTLYGHNEELTVSEGQSVGQGQQIAWCGSTGNSTGPHCHFEVRVNGETTSPWDYL